MNIWCHIGWWFEICFSSVDFQENWPYNFWDWKGATPGGFLYAGMFTELYTQSKTSKKRSSDWKWFGIYQLIKIDLKGRKKYSFDVSFPADPCWHVLRQYHVQKFYNSGDRSEALLRIHAQMEKKLIEARPAQALHSCSSGWLEIVQTGLYTCISLYIDLLICFYMPTVVSQFCFEEMDLLPELRLKNVLGRLEHQWTKWPSQPAGVGSFTWILLLYYFLCAYMTPWCHLCHILVPFPLLMLYFFPLSRCLKHYQFPSTSSFYHPPYILHYIYILWLHHIYILYIIYIISIYIIYYIYILYIYIPLSVVSHVPSMFHPFFQLAKPIRSLRPGVGSAPGGAGDGDGGARTRARLPGRSHPTSAGHGCHGMPWRPWDTLW